MAEKKTVKKEEVIEEIVKDEPMVTIKLEKSRDNKLPLFVSAHGLQHTRLLCPPLSPRVYSNWYPLSQ